MKVSRLLLAGCLVILAAGHVLAQANFSTSLHATRAGKLFWYGTANGGFQTLTNVPIDSLQCMQCHGPTNADGQAYTGTYTPGCVDCHKTGVFTKDSLKVDQCLGCHSRQKTEYATLGYRDVHRDRGMKCWDCHVGVDVHGGPTVFNSMLEPGAIDVECEDCHKTTGGTAPLPNHAAFDPHGGKIHCTACHARTVISCFSCHLESQIRERKRHRQALHDFVILGNRTKDNKVYPVTLQSLTYNGLAWAAYGPYTPHTIDSTGRGCADCHNNIGGNLPAITQYNATGVMKFVTWNPADSTVSWLRGVIPFPADYKRSFQMDYLTYNGAPTDAVVPSKNWSPIGKTIADGSHMLFATPLTKVQMAKLGFDTTKVTDVAEPVGPVPAAFTLAQNYPNPFNPATTIEFALPRATQVTLVVYDVLGAEIQTLVADRRMEAGLHRVMFTGDNLPSGVYLYKLVTPEYTFARKMALLK